MFPELPEDVPGRTILDELPPTRAAILRVLKEEGFASITRLAEILGVTHEAARKQVADLQRSGWIASDCPPGEQAPSAPGRPSVRYCLTAAGDHLFPKQYPQLTVQLLEAVSDEALIAALTQLTDERVDALAPRVEGLPLDRKMDELRAIYAEGDPYTVVDGHVLVERNCPYLTVALEHPEICSTTVSTLRRLTGCEVVRERRFQDGDGRCEFHVRAAEPGRTEVRFEPEPPRTERSATSRPGTR